MSDYKDDNSAKSSEEREELSSVYTSSFSEYEIEDDDNLYRLPDDEETDEKDEEEEDPDSDDADEDGEDDENKGKKLFCAVELLFKIMTTPVEGWKELRRKHLSPDYLGGGCFLPMVFLASISDFADKIYGTYITSGECLMQAVTTFIKYFFGYFTVLLVGGIFLPKSCKEVLQSNIGKSFVMMNMSTLALFYAIRQFLPMLDSALVFLPIWTIYLIYKGVRFLRVSTEVESRTKVIFTLLILGAPLLWEWLIGLFI